MHFRPQDSLFSSGTDPARVVVLDGESLDIGSVSSVARKGSSAELNAGSRERTAKAAGNLQTLVQRSAPIYGVNTGFGMLSSKKIDAGQLDELSRNLVLSHSVGFGEPLAEDIVRAAILVRANTLAKGVSGVRPVVIDTLLSLLSRHVTPVIPSRGSLGSSGDLAPLAHLALMVSAHPETPGTQYSGEAWFQGKRISGSAALHAAGIPPLRLYPKEGLALINGATFSAAMLALSLADAYVLLDSAVSAAVLSFEALQGISTALDARIQEARQHPGQMEIAQVLRRQLSGSTLVDSSGRVQDAYTLRCIPQVLGPVAEILGFVHQMTLREINAATDNPLLFGEEALSGGNFHGEPISLGADYLKNAFCEVGALSERRVFRLLSFEEQTGLPAMLVPDPAKSGLQSGLMLLQYTAASLALENQTLAAPDSIHSLPTSGGQEDHNANAMNAVRNLSSILRNVSGILAIEMITAAAALDIRMARLPGSHPSPYTRKLHDLIRVHVPVYTADTPWSGYMAAVSDLILSGEVIRLNTEQVRE